MPTFQEAVAGLRKRFAAALHLLGDKIGGGRVHSDGYGLMLSPIPREKKLERASLIWRDIKDELDGVVRTQIAVEPFGGDIIAHVRPHPGWWKAQQSTKG
jgi:hypothetical protein